MATAAEQSQQSRVGNTEAQQSMAGRARLTGLAVSGSRAEQEGRSRGPQNMAGSERREHHPKRKRGTGGGGGENIGAREGGGEVGGLAA